jgi:hypothetical protein
LLEEPCGVGAVPLGGAGIGHGLHHLILHAERSGASLGFRPHGTKASRPSDTRIGRGARDDRCCGSVFNLGTAESGRPGRGRHAQSGVGRNRHVKKRPSTIKVPYIGNPTPLGCDSRIFYMRRAQPSAARQKGNGFREIELISPQSPRHWPQPRLAGPCRRLLRSHR